MQEPDIRQPVGNALGGARMRLVRAAVAQAAAARE